MENLYKITGRKGIDDLKSLYAFVGNSQGDSSASNSIEEYQAAKGWMSFVFDCNLTQEAIEEEIQKRKSWNDAYIKELKEDFIKTLSNEFSGGYIIVAPDKKGLIVDFSLDISVYDAITEKLKIKK